MPDGPIEVDISSAPKCSVPTCSARFSLIRWRQRCPACLKAVCAACCAVKTMVPWHTVRTPEPVCTICRSIISDAAKLQVRYRALFLMSDSTVCDTLASFLSAMCRCMVLMLMLRVCCEQAGTTSRAWGVPKPPVITLIHGTRVTVRIAGTTPAPALLAVEGVEVQQEHGPVTFAPSTATEVELTLAMSSQRLRLRWMSGGVGGPWSAWAVSEHVALASWWHVACTTWTLCDSYESDGLGGVGACPRTSHRRIDDSAWFRCGMIHHHCAARRPLVCVQCPP